MSNDLEYAYGTCRDLRHRWDRKVILRLDEGGRLLLRATSCEDCGTVRVERFGVSTRGRVTVSHGARYTYPRGYRLTGRHNPSEFRVAALEAALRAGVIPTEAD